MWPLNKEWWWQHSQFLRCFLQVLGQKRQIPEIWYNDPATQRFLLYLAVLFRAQFSFIFLNLNLTHCRSAISWIYPQLSPVWYSTFFLEWIISFWKNNFWMNGQVVFLNEYFRLNLNWILDWIVFGPDSMLEWINKMYRTELPQLTLFYVQALSRLSLWIL